MSLLRTTTSALRAFCRSGHCNRRAIQWRWLNLTSREIEGDDIDDTGIYEVVLPPDPPIYGVSHITPRNVPDAIPRPPYATRDRVERGILSPSESADPFHGDPYSGDGRIILGGPDETRLRRAAAIAKQVLERAKTLVKVSRTCTISNKSH